MAKKTINAKEILTDIKAGMDNTALMEKYGLSEKGLQTLFKKLVDAGVLKPREPEKSPSEPEKSVETAWKCSQCGKPQPKPFDQCPECGKIGSKIKTQISEQVEEIKGQESEEKSHLGGINGLHEAQERIYEASSTALNKVKPILRKPYIAAVVGAAIMVVIVVIFFGVQRRAEDSSQRKAVASNPSNAESERTKPSESVKSTKGGLPKETEEQIVEHYESLPPQLFIGGPGGHADVKEVTKHGADYHGLYIGLIKPRKIRILRAEVGVPTKDIISKINPKKIWCIKLAIETEWGRKLSRYSDNGAMDFGRFEIGVEYEKRGQIDKAIEYLKLTDVSLDNSSESLLNVMVRVSQSGKITGSVIDGDALYSGTRNKRNCPEDWDNVCPFGCRE